MYNALKSQVVLSFSTQTQLTQDNIQALARWFYWTNNKFCILAHKIFYLSPRILFLFKILRWEPWDQKTYHKTTPGPHVRRFFSPPPLSATFISPPASPLPSDRHLHALVVFLAAPSPIRRASRGLLSLHSPSPSAAVAFSSSPGGSPPS